MRTYARLAQLVEHLIDVERVIGSSPIPRTMKSNSLTVLGIETSCDETAISIIRINGDEKSVDILGNVVHSQIALHAPYGGVFPMLAKREHQHNLVPVLKKSLEQAGMWHTALQSQEIPDVALDALAHETELREAFKATLPTLNRPPIEYISVTVGPGLEPALWVGVNFARALSMMWNIPLVPANHMEGHILAALIKKDAAKYSLLDHTITYPALSLLISGGHTQIVLVEKIGSYKIVGETHDDAIGECFDKVARMLGLTYPGGPKISKLAAEARAKNIQSPEPLPRPMIKSPDLNFSFSGLKTAVLYLTQRLSQKGISLDAPDDVIRKGISREVEDAVTDVIVAKMRKAIDTYNVQTLVVGGGVIANSHIRTALEKLADECSLPILLPQTDHSTDNGLMIALAGYFNKDKAVEGQMPLKAQGTLSLGPRP